MSVQSAVFCSVRDCRVYSKSRWLQPRKHTALANTHPPSLFTEFNKRAHTNPHICVSPSEVEARVLLLNERQRSAVKWNQRTHVHFQQSNDHIKFTTAAATTTAVRTRTWSFTASLQQPTISLTWTCYVGVHTGGCWEEPRREVRL